MSQPNRRIYARAHISLAATIIQTRRSPHGQKHDPPRCSAYPAGDSDRQRIKHPHARPEVGAVGHKLEVHRVLLINVLPLDIVKEQ